MKRGKIQLMTNHTKFASGRLALSLAALLLAGCGGARPSKYYQLTVPGDAAPAADPNPLPVDLLIGRIAAPGLYHEDQIVYSSGGEHMGTYEYQRWAEPPVEMIQEVILRQLRSSGRFRNVNLLRSNVHGDFLLHGHLYDFKEVSAGSTVARVTIELELRDVKTHKTLWTHFYTHDEPAAAKDITAVVDALNRNIQQGIAQARTLLEQYFTEHPPAPSTP